MPLQLLVSQFPARLPATVLAPSCSVPTDGSVRLAPPGKSVDSMKEIAETTPAHPASKANPRARRPSSDFARAVRVTCGNGVLSGPRNEAVGRESSSRQRQMSPANDGATVDGGRRSRVAIAKCPSRFLLRKSGAETVTTGTSATRSDQAHAGNWSLWSAVHDLRTRGRTSD